MPSTTGKKNVARLVIIICGIAFVASLAFSISFFYRDLPNRPRPEVGRIYPLNNHGYYLYLTRKEHLEETVSGYVGLGLFLLICVIEYMFQPFEAQNRMWELWQKAESARQWPWNHRWRP